MRTVGDKAFDPAGSTWHGSVHRPDIQALRGVAVLLVVFYHAGLGFSGGFVGVDAFFVISGYVIATTLVRELERSGTISLRQFYIRRIRRLMPALALVSIVVLTICVVLLPFDEQPFAAGTGLAATFFAANVYLYRVSGGYFEPAGETNPFLHTWSLSVEEQFYFVLPVALILLWWLAQQLGVRSPKRSMSAVFAVVALVSLWWSWQTTNGDGFFAGVFGSPERFAFYAPVTRVWEFLAGVLLALAPATLPIGYRAAIAMRGAGLSALLYAAVTFDELTLFPGTAAALPVLATALIIAAGSVAPMTEALPSVSSGWSSARDGLVWIGDLSFSWYLWHWPAIVLTASVWPNNQALLAVAALTSLFPAWLSKRWVEDPIRFRLPTGWVSLALVVAVCLLTPAATALVVRGGSTSNWGVALPTEWEERRLAGQIGCVDTPEKTWPTDRCLIRATSSQGLILLLGDSHASSASDGVAEAAVRLGMNFGVWAKSGCPLLLERAPHNDNTCPSWQEAALAAIDLHEPDIVIIANRSSGYTASFGEKVWRLIANASGERPETQAEALISWEEGLKGLLNHISRNTPTTHVVLFANVPEYSPDDFEVSLFRGPGDPPTIDRNYVDQRRRVLEVEANIVERFPQVEIVDPADILCQPSQCRAGDGDTWWYMDEDHLNPKGSLALADALTVKLRSTLLK